MRIVEWFLRAVALAVVVAGPLVTAGCSEAKRPAAPDGEARVIERWWFSQRRWQKADVKDLTGGECVRISDRRGEWRVVDRPKQAGPREVRRDVGGSIWVEPWGEK